ncbi:MAG TPA: hypothetical protein VF167_14975 [Longimicrobiaceae bacterium]
MNKWIALVLQVLAAFLFIGAGAEEEILVIPAAITQVASLILLSQRPNRRRALPEPQEEALVQRLARMEEVLIGVQADVANLRDGREFMEELYGVKTARARSLRSPSEV